MLETIAAILFEPTRFGSIDRREALRSLVLQAWKDERDPGGRDLYQARASGFRLRLPDYEHAIFGSEREALATPHGRQARAEKTPPTERVDWDGPPPAMSLERTRSLAAEAFAVDLHALVELHAQVDDGVGTVSAADVLGFVKDAIESVRKGCGGYIDAKKYVSIDNVLTEVSGRIADAQDKARLRLGVSPRTAYRKRNASRKRAKEGATTEDGPAAPWLSLRNASPMFAILSVEAGDWPKSGEDEVPLEFGHPDGLAVAAVAAMISRSRAHGPPVLPLALLVTCLDEAFSHFRNECALPPVADGPFGYAARLEQRARISVDLAAAVRRWSSWEGTVRLPRSLDRVVRLDAETSTPRDLADEVAAHVLEQLGLLSISSEGEDLFASVPLTMFELEEDEAAKVNAELEAVSRRIRQRWENAIKSASGPAE